MFQKHETLFGVLRKSLSVQYLLLSLPSVVVSQNLDIKIYKKTAWIEFSVTLLAAFAEFVAMIYLYKYTASFSIYNILLILKTCSSILFGTLVTLEVATKLEQTKAVLDDIKKLEKFIKMEQKNVSILKVKLITWTVVVMSIVVISTAILIIFRYSVYAEIILIFNSFRLYLQPFASEIQFLLLMNLVQMYFESARKQLEETVIKFPPEKCKSHRIRCLHPKRTQCKTADEIERLRKVYGHINDLKNNVNSIFSLRIWFGIADVVLQYITVIYFGIVHLKNSDRMKDTNEQIDFYYLIYQGIIITLEFLQLVHLSDKVAQSGTSFRVSLQGIFSRSYCERVHKELKIFSLELLHRDPNVTAFKIYVVDNKLISEVIAEVVMILIAIIQFEAVGTSEESRAMYDYIADIS